MAPIDPKPKEGSVYFRYTLLLATKLKMLNKNVSVKFLYSRGIDYFPYHINFLLTPKDAQYIFQRRFLIIQTKCIELQMIL